MTDPQTIDERLATAAQNTNRRLQISALLSRLVEVSAVRRQRYQNELEAGKVNPQKLLQLNDDWQSTEREIIGLTEEFKTLIPEFREKEG